ncbi:dUTP diphosphatase [Bartonella sp. A05]|uniref:dUTP diphosphatase n=1 Tax=Bartonella sp. A05 TaxID=2967261 RepID=UPI0022A9B5DF|nr:dUTP diphosphatase [Bartonella sp. A05]MCZ2203679.1 dUTP diphosphatase [Bartonella sp. A05]
MPHSQTNAPLNNEISSSHASSSPPQKMTLLLQRLEHGQDLELPNYATAGSAGFDLRAALAEDETVELAPGQRALIPTGLVFHLMPGYEAQIRSRSGLSLNHGIVVLNAPGTIDSDYRGEVKVILINLGQETFSIQRGMRIAQTIIAPVIQVDICTIETAQEICTPADTKTRGTGGFGSTGYD